MLTESYKKRLLELAGVNANQTVLIRSKEDPSFRLEATADDTGKIIKGETQGDFKKYMKDPIDINSPWFRFYLGFGIGKQLDFNIVRQGLKDFPELYVADIV